MSKRHDYLGTEITVDDKQTQAAIDDFVGGLLGYETRAAGIIAAADRDPECCLANLYAAALHMLLEAPAAPANAAPYLVRAEQASRTATERERGLVRFVQLWQQDAIPNALEVGEALSRAFPRDLTLVKLLQYLSFNLGDAARMLRLAVSVEAENRDVPHFHGMLAFALEQCHLLDDAEAAARQALRLSPKEPWAQHALAHITLTTARLDEGSAFLESVQGSWTDLNSFMLTHLWWHQSLFYLSQGRFERVLTIYDTRCWGVEKSYSQDQAGAVSLLARLELAGADVGQRWQELAPYLAVRQADTVQPFLTLHYIYGLARAGREEAVLLLDAVRTHANTAPDFSRATWARIALPAAAALFAHATGNYAQAIDGLETALPRLAAIGGSHAQRDLFEQIYLDALERTGRWSDAQQLLEIRRRFDPGGVPINRKLTKTYDRLGLPVQAQQAAQRALLTERSHPA
jgi:tetratricopeptide (TPR) repeat protein